MNYIMNYRVWNEFLSAVWPAGKLLPYKRTEIIWLDYSTQIWIKSVNAFIVLKHKNDIRLTTTDWLGDNLKLCTISKVPGGFFNTYLTQVQDMNTIAERFYLEIKNFILKYGNKNIKNKSWSIITYDLQLLLVGTKFDEQLVCVLTWTRRSISRDGGRMRYWLGYSDALLHTLAHQLIVYDWTLDTLLSESQIIHNIGSSSPLPSVCDDFLSFPVSIGLYFLIWSNSVSIQLYRLSLQLKHMSI